MSKSIARILWVLSRTNAAVVGHGEVNMLNAARQLQAEDIVALTDRGDGTYLVRLIRDAY